MEEDLKQLLLADFCARLPYNVRGEIGACKNCIIYPHDIENFERGERNIKLYLRPMSSMTDVEKHIFDTMTRGYTVHQQATLFDWLNAHHFDFRGLIEKGLAISTEEYNPYKE